jgi:hypothetical protein
VYQKYTKSASPIDTSRVRNNIKPNKPAISEAYYALDNYAAILLSIIGSAITDTNNTEYKNADPANRIAWA